MNRQMKDALPTKFYRNTAHKCGRCKANPKILLRVKTWSRRVCISCAKRVAYNMDIMLRLPTKKQLKPKKRRKREAA